MMELTREYIAVWAPMLVLVIALIYSLLRDWIYLRKGKEKERIPFGEAFGKAIADTPSILAFFLTATIIVMALTETKIPDFLANVFFVIIGYYFGVHTRPQPDQAQSEQSD